MNKNQFHQYLIYPDQLNADSLVELDELVNEYPYFQAARMLFVKNLKNEENIRFNRQLKFAAASINNRQLLFGLLNRIRISNDGSFFPDITHKTSQKINIESRDEPHIADENLITEGILSLADDNPEQDVLPSGSDSSSGYDKSFYVKELERFIPIADLDLLLFDFPVDNSDILDPLITPIESETSSDNNEIPDNYNPDDEAEDSDDYSFGWDYNSALASEDDNEKVKSEDLDEDERYALGLDKSNNNKKEE